MIFTPLSIPGAWLIEHEPFADHRGKFWRQWDSDEMAAHGIPPTVQSNVSVNPHLGTLRGFHLQEHPHGEAKTLTCLRGRVDDVLIDLRPDSPTYKSHVSVILSGAKSLHVPVGVANCFLTREAETIVFYEVSAPYTPSAERGIRWDDPAFGVKWFMEPRVISAKDASWPLLGDA